MTARVIYDRRTGEPLGEVRPGRFGRWYIRKPGGEITPAHWTSDEAAEEALRGETA